MLIGRRRGRRIAGNALTLIPLRSRIASSPLSAEGGAQGLVVKVRNALLMITLLLTMEIVMKTCLRILRNPTAWALGLVGIFIVAMSASANAAEPNDEIWNQRQAELQKELAPGEPADAYSKKIEKLGYKITSTNYNDPDYLEYELVKGDQTWEVQIDVDDDTHRATKVDVVTNMWKTDATDQALANNRDRAGEATATTSESRRTAALRNNPYSERDRATTEQLVKELEALPTGHDKQFYKDALQKRGFEISRVDTDETDELDLEAVKDGRSVQMDIDFDKETGKSTEIDASSLWAESESTTQTRESQQRQGSSSRPSSKHTSDVEQRSQADVDN